MTDATSTRSTLIDALRTNGDDAARTLRALPEDAFNGGRYENGWNAKQILAHIAAIEWTYRRLLDVAATDAPGDGAQPPSAVPPTDKPANVAQPSPAASPPIRRTTPEESPNLPTRTAQGGIDAYNDRQIQKRADTPIADLIAEFEKNRAATIDAVQDASDDLLARPIRSAGGITGPLAGVLRAVAIDHVAMHVADIAGTKHEGARW